MRFRGYNTFFISTLIVFFYYFQSLTADISRRVLVKGILKVNFQILEIII